MRRVTHDGEARAKLVRAGLPSRNDFRIPLRIRADHARHTGSRYPHSGHVVQSRSLAGGQRVCTEREDARVHARSVATVFEDTDRTFRRKQEIIMWELVIFRRDIFR